MTAVLALAQGGADAADETPRRAVAGGHHPGDCLWRCWNCHEVIGVVRGRTVVTPIGEKYEGPFRLRLRCLNCFRFNRRTFARLRRRD